MILNSGNRKSTFLNRREFRNDRFERSVLVVGDNWMGQEIAGRLTALGMDVVVADLKASVTGASSSFILVPDSIEGQSGQFQAAFHNGNSLSKKDFGFIVAAQQAENIPRLSDYGLQEGPRVFSVSGILELIDNGGSLPERNAQWYHAAFVDDLTGDSEPATFGQFLDVLENLLRIENFQAYVFTRHLKVAGPELEKRYRSMRERGVIFFKFDDSRPLFSNESGEWKIFFNEPLLKLDVELTPDLIVADEKMCPPSTLRQTFGQLLSYDIAKPYLQSESPRFHGVLTSKTGLFAVGPSRGIYDRDKILEDIDAVEFEIKKSLADSGLHLDQVPVVDKSKCAFCLTCVRLCPHGAITFFERAQISSRSCMKCGICVAECPMGAISSHGPQTPLKAVLRGDSSEYSKDSCAGKIALFLCSRSAAQAYKAVEFIYQDDVAVFEVNCAGSLETKRILGAFRNGATAVLIGGCFKGNCASVYGNILCSGRVDSVKTFASLLYSGSASSESPGSTDMDSKVGASVAERIRFVHTASNTPEILAKAISELRNSLNRR